MKKLLQIFLGLNAAGIVRGLRFGPRDFIKAGYTGLSAVHPLENKIQKNIKENLKSIPEITITEILGDRRSAIKLNVQKYEDGMLPSHEAMALLAVLLAENPREVLEIGTYMGFTSKAMAENLETAVIHTIDLPPDYSTDQAPGDPLPKDDFHLINRRIVGREFKGQESEKRIVQHFGDTANLDFTKIGNPTFFFIDGSHTYEYCKNDSEKCFELCQEKGVFLWHDCDQSHPGVIRFISEWRTAGRNITRIEGTSLAYWKSL